MMSIPLPLKLVIVASCLQAVISQPIGTTPTPTREKVGKATFDITPKPRPSEGKSLFPFMSENEQGLDRTADILRSRRSPPGIKFQPSNPSAELQTIMSGNWKTMDPESLFSLLNNLASSKEAMPEDLYGYDDEEDDPIDLVYTGKQPMIESSLTRNRGSAAPFRGITEPISLMSSGSGRGKLYRFTEDEDDVVQPLQLHRLYKKPIFKRAFHPQMIWQKMGPPRRDLVQLPSGEIALTPYGLHVLKYVNPLS